MKRTTTLTLLLFFLVSLTASRTAWATPIDENQAQKIAASFMSSHAVPSAGLKLTRKVPRLGGTADTRGTAYYVFNATAGGYVIVAGDDRAPAVLAYSDQGTLDTADVPEALQELLDSYAEQIDLLSQQQATATASLTSRAPIAPMLTATFSQNSPYNIKLPYIEGKHAYVGCVATAVAQVMHYWKYPQSTTMTVPGYTTENLQIFMPALPVTTFNWNMIQPSYLTNDTLSAQGLEAGKLSLYCAQALRMDFKKSSSSAYSNDIPKVLRDYFGYKPQVKYLQRKFFTTAQWEEMIYSELAAGRPIIYSGSKKSGGHAFVCDGYNDGLYHINWGWNGLSNGYFVLNILNPDAQGTGGVDGAYGYVMNQAMVTQIEPGSGSSTDLMVTARQFEVTTYSANRTSSNYDFTATVITHFFNITDEPISFSYGWALYQGDTFLKMVYDQGKRESLDSWYYIYPTVSVAFGSGLANGTYRLVPMYRDYNGTTAWKPCPGSDVNYARIIIDGNRCNVTAFGQSATPSYYVNDIEVSGHMHLNRPVYIDMKLTNQGYTRNDVIYVHRNGTLVTAGLVDLAKDSTGVVHFEYMPQVKGNNTLSFSLNENGSNPIASRSFIITQVPQVELAGTSTVLNATNTSPRTINSDKFSIRLNVTNNSSTAYDEDITVKLYKHIYDNYGSQVQTVTRDLYLAPHESTTIQIDLDNVIDGWKYFAKSYYYTSDESTLTKEVQLTSTSFYTVVFPTVPQFKPGDVNNDGEVNISDINALTAYLISGNDQGINLQAADCNNDGEVNISDVNALIALILK